MSTPAATTTERPLRADAERNRLRIIDAAQVVFARRGLGASLDEVAAEAGVGVGTVYRRFPDKDALVDALFEQKIGTVTDLAQSCLEIEDPWEGFETFVRGVCELQAVDRGFKEVLAQSERGRERVAMAKEKITPIAAQILARAKADGSLRADIEQFDVPLLNMMVGFAAEATADISPDYWRRPLQIVLDGMRADRSAPSPLPGDGLDAEQFATAMSSAKQPRC